jgi:phospholipase C
MRRLRRRAPVAALATLLACSSASAQETATPIRHLIVLIGENRSFDNVYATYEARAGQSVANLLSSGIVGASGALGANADRSRQYRIGPPYPAKYFVDAAATAGKTAYRQAPAEPGFPPPNTSYVPQAPGGLDRDQAPFDAAQVPDALLASVEPPLKSADRALLRTGASGLPGKSTDTRVANAAALPNGVYRIGGAALPYDSFTGDMVHRFFHMWQQSDCSAKSATAGNPSGCLSDLYAFVGVARNDGSGSNAMGFYDMRKGDAPILKRLADEFTLADNYHQPVMGGTAVQHIMLGAADMIGWEAFQDLDRPPVAGIADPDPRSPSDAAFRRDAEWANCSDAEQPGVAAITRYLAGLPWHPSPHCEAGRYYMVNNLPPGFLPNGRIDTAGILKGDKVPPSTLRTIGDALNEKRISWAYYGGGYDAAVRVADGGKEPADLLSARAYCDICNPFSYAVSIMGDEQQRKRHIRDVIDFLRDLDEGRLPAVAYVKPDSLTDGHPGSSKLNLFEALAQSIFERLKARPELFANTALLVTVDEAGGYWDSGAFLPLDFFGDGPRIPLVVVSPYSRGGKVVHSYGDHVSIVKFIERNWGLKPLTARSRDNLPNPVMSAANPYVPANIPAIGDLFDMFEFPRR